MLVLHRRPHGWQRWFAWHPVTLDHPRDIVWLGWVDRLYCATRDREYFWKYRLPRC